MNNEHLTYLTIKYGDVTYKVGILEELPIEVVLNAYRKYSKKNLPSIYNNNLTDDDIINRLSEAMEKFKEIPNSTFSEVFTEALSEEIKKYYEQ